MGQDDSSSFGCFKEMCSVYDQQDRNLMQTEWIVEICILTVILFPRET